MLKKLILSASCAALAAGVANAVELENVETAVAANVPYLLAAELDFDGTTGVTETIDIGIAPSAGAFPTGNLLVHVTITGGTFASALSGAEFTGATSSVISSGGASGGTDVVFVVSGADACNADTAAATFEADCFLGIPIDLDGSDVAFSVGITTDAGAPVDNTDATNRVSLTTVSIQPAFSIDIDADTNPTIADLNATAGPFLGFVTGGANDSILGSVTAAANTVMQAGGAQTVNTAFGGAAPVAGGDVGSIAVTLTGTLDSFDPTAPAPVGAITYGGSAFVAANVDTTTDTATIDGIGSFGAAAPIVVTADGATAIARSDYDVAVTINPATASALVSTTSASGELQSIARNGTTVVIPWTSTQTQGAATGTTSVYRIGNLDNSPSGAVFVEARSSSEAGYVNPGIVQLATSIPANGELVTNSTSIEAAVGNYGRGDIEFTVEADPDTLTARQFVIRGDVIQNVIGGTVMEDQQ